jgi:phosphohistidine phosphatase SixA
MRAWIGSISMTLGVVGCATSPDCPPAGAPTVAAAADVDEGTEPAQEPTDEAPVILLVRHAEKASDGTPDPPLTERGVRRSECLARMLEGFAPTHLLATQYQRTAATLRPLAAASGREIAVIEAQDEAAWSRTLSELPPGARAVVAGHSNTLPGWIASLGGRLGDLDAKGNIPDDDYDRLVHVVRHGPGQATSYTLAYCTE